MAVSVVTNLAVAVSVANQVCLVAHLAVAAVSVASVVVSVHLQLALVVAQQVELVVVATVESVVQVQVARLVQRSKQCRAYLAERMKLRGPHHHHPRAAPCHRLANPTSLVSLVSPKLQLRQ